MTFRRFLIILVILTIVAAVVSIVLQRMSGYIPVAQNSGGSPNLSLATPPASMLGDYGGVGCPPNDDTCVPTQSSDSVKITRGPDGQIRASIDISFPGQLCGIEDNISWTGDQFILKPQGSDDANQCELNLKVKDSILTIEDPGLRCRDSYCGTHGTFNGTRFKHR